MDRLFITVVFFINNKRNGKNFMVKYIPSVNNFTVFPQYKKLFLYINLKLVPFAPNLPVHSLSLISILGAILSSSKSFLK